MGEFYYVFIGLIVGAAGIATILGIKQQSKGLSNFMLVGLCFVVMYLFSIEAGWFSIGIIIASIFGFVRYNSESEKQTSNNNHNNYKYINHCWFCHSSIDSRYNQKCPKCNRYYICNHCGRCLCDSPEYNRN